MFTLSADGMLNIASLISSVESSIRETVATLSEPIRGIVLYHLCLDNAKGGAPANFSATLHGIGLLSILCLSDGGKIESWNKVRNVAIAGGLMAGAGLLLDDLCDGETRRWRRPAAWTLFGAPAASLAAMAMMTLGYELIAREPADVAAKVIRMLTPTLRESMAATLRDIRTERNVQISLSESIANKAQLGATIFATCGAVLAFCRGGTEAQIEAAKTCGYHVGMVMALQDDWDDMWADRSDEQTQPMADLRRRKMLPCVAFALQSSGPARDRLAAYYQDTTDPDPEQLRQVRALIEECGGRTWLEEQIQEHLNAADDALPAVVPDPYLRVLVGACMDEYTSGDADALG